MAKTKAQVINRVARKLGRVAVGQNLEADLESVLSDSYDQVYDELDEMNLATWASDSVPDRYVPHVAALVAADNLEGIPTSRQQAILVVAARAKIEISNLTNGIYTNPRGITDF